MPKDNKIAYLRIATWKERLWYAVHYYGVIDLNDTVTPDIEVRKKLTAAEARAMVKIDKRRGEHQFKWKEGDSCGAFLERTTLIDAAKKLLPAGYNALVDGHPYTQQPQPIVWAKKKFTHQKNRINALDKLVEAVGGWEEDEESMKKICEEWEKLFEEISNG